MKILVTAAKLIRAGTWENFCQIRCIMPWEYPQGIPMDTMFALS